MRHKCLMYARLATIPPVLSASAQEQNRFWDRRNEDGYPLSTALGMVPEHGNKDDEDTVSGDYDGDDNSYCWPNAYA
uniref:Secreted protein n=1 Tax=Steinernema glaseri TaxID=37863 RepID=A0A1I7Z439_9BILA